MESKSKTVKPNARKVSRPHAIVNGGIARERCGGGFRVRRISAKY